VSLTNAYASLGYNCEPAYQFRRITGHDEAAYFNWTFCRLSSVLKIIQANFNGVLEWENIQPHGIMIYERLFDLAFHGDVFNASDGGKDVEAALELWHAMRNKLAYLAQRWRQTASSEGHTTYFLKLLQPIYEPADPRQQAIETRDVLRTSFPDHRFTIIVLQSLQLVDREDDWGIDQIHNRYLTQYAPDTDPWLAHTPSWDEIFAEFQLIPMEQRRASVSDVT
jgi:Putative papain-like cysteine peptidase (DUF1796)